MAPSTMVQSSVADSLGNNNNASNIRELQQSQPDSKMEHNLLLTKFPVAANALGKLGPTLTVILDRYTESTLNAMLGYFNKFLEFIDNDIDEIDALDICNYASNRYSGLTRKSVTLAITNFLDLVSNQPLGKHPLIQKFNIGVMRQHPGKLTVKECLTDQDYNFLNVIFQHLEEEYQKRLTNMEIRTLVMLQLIIEGAFRVKDLTCLQSNVEIKEDSIVLTIIGDKSFNLKNKPRTPHTKVIARNDKVDIGKLMTNYLPTIPASSTLLFPNLSKPLERLKPQTIRTLLTAKLDKLNITWKPGQIRSFTTSIALAKGAARTEVVKMGGWADEKVFTEHYQRMTESHKHKFSDALRLNIIPVERELFEDIDGLEEAEEPNNIIQELEKDSS